MLCKCKCPSSCPHPCLHDCFSTYPWKQYAITVVLMLFWVYMASISLHNSIHWRIVEIVSLMMYQLTHDMLVEYFGITYEISIPACLCACFPASLPACLPTPCACMSTCLLACLRVLMPVCICDRACKNRACGLIKFDFFFKLSRLITFYED